MTEEKRERRDEATISRRPPEESEKRTAARYDIELDMHMGSEHNFFSGFIENLSVGGVFVATHQIKDLGETFAFSIFLPDRKEPVSGTGEVRWLRPYNESSDTSPGMGIRFVELDPDSDWAIAQFIKDRDPLFFDE